MSVDSQSLVTLASTGYSDPVGGGTDTANQSKGKVEAYPSSLYDRLLTNTPPSQAQPSDSAAPPSTLPITTETSSLSTDAANTVQSGQNPQQDVVNPKSQQDDAKNSLLTGLVSTSLPSNISPFEQDTTPPYIRARMSTPTSLEETNLNKTDPHYLPATVVDSITNADSDSNYADENAAPDTPNADSQATNDGAAATADRKSTTAAPAATGGEDTTPTEQVVFPLAGGTLASLQNSMLPVGGGSTLGDASGGNGAMFSKLSGMGPLPNQPMASMTPFMPFGGSGAMAPLAASLPYMNSGMTMNGMTTMMPFYSSGGLAGMNSSLPVQGNGYLSNMQAYYSTVGGGSISPWESMFPYMNGGTLGAMLVPFMIMSSLAMTTMNTNVDFMNRTLSPLSNPAEMFYNGSLPNMQGVFDNYMNRTLGPMNDHFDALANKILPPMQGVTCPTTAPLHSMASNMNGMMAAPMNAVMGAMGQANNAVNGMMNSAMAGVSSATSTVTATMASALAPVEEVTSMGLALATPSLYIASIIANTLLILNTTSPLGYASGTVMGFGMPAFSVYGPENLSFMAGSMARSITAYEPRLTDVVVVPEIAPPVGNPTGYLSQKYSSGLNNVKMTIKATILPPGAAQTPGSPTIPPTEEPPPYTPVEPSAPPPPPTYEPSPSYSEIPITYDPETNQFSAMEQTSDPNTSSS